MKTLRRIKPGSLDGLAPDDFAVGAQSPAKCSFSKSCLPGWASACLGVLTPQPALPLIPPSLQERLAQCQDQSSRQAAELRDFKNKMLPLLEVAEKEREALRTEADTISGRVDRLEREVDYLETQNPALPCVELDEKATGGPGAKGKSRRNEKYDMVTGKRSQKRPNLRTPLPCFSPCPKPPWLRLPE